MDKIIIIIKNTHLITIKGELYLEINKQIKFRDDATRNRSERARDTKHDAAAFFSTGEKTRVPSHALVLFSLRSRSGPGDFRTTKMLEGGRRGRRRVGGVQGGVG